MKPKLIILIGSPGSGKTSYIKQLKSNGFTDYDDYFSKAKDDYGVMSNSRYKNDLINALGNQENCVIADIEFSQSSAQNDLKQFIIENDLNNIAAIEWQGFENDKFACMVNVVNRNMDDFEKTIKQIKSILDLSEKYIIPKNAKIMKTWIWPRKTEFKVKNDRDEFDITIEAKEMCENKKEYNDIRIRYSIEILNSNKDLEVHISDIIVYIDWCKDCELIRMEKLAGEMVKRAVEETINLNIPGDHNITSESFDFRTRK